MCAGTYFISANILINKPVTLLGNGGFPNPRPILNMIGACESILVVASPNVTIDNLHLQVNGAGGTSTNGKHGIFVDNHGTPGAYNNLLIQIMI